MATRLPVPGSDDGEWGSILNQYLLQSHTTDGQLRPNTVGPSQLQAGAVTFDSLADDVQIQSTTPGPKGQDGVSIVSITLDATGTNYIIELSDGSSQTVAAPALDLTAIEEAIDAESDARDLLEDRVVALESAPVPDHDHPEYAPLLVLGSDDPVPEGTADGTLIFRSS